MNILINRRINILLNGKNKQINVVHPLTNVNNTKLIFTQTNCKIKKSTQVKKNLYLSGLQSADQIS